MVNNNINYKTGQHLVLNQRFNSLVNIIQYSPYEHYVKLAEPHVFYLSFISHNKKGQTEYKKFVVAESIPEALDKYYSQIKGKAGLVAPIYWKRCIHTLKVVSLSYLFANSLESVQGLSRSIRKNAS